MMKKYDAFYCICRSVIFLYPLGLCFLDFFSLSRVIIRRKFFFFCDNTANLYKILESCGKSYVDV